MGGGDGEAFFVGFFECRRGVRFFYFGVRGD